MIWFVDINIDNEQKLTFQFDNFEDAVKFIELYEEGFNLKCNYEIKRSDL